MTLFGVLNLVVSGEAIEGMYKFFKNTGPTNQEKQSEVAHIGKFEFDQIRTKFWSVPGVKVSIHNILSHFTSDYVRIEWMLNVTAPQILTEFLGKYANMQMYQPVENRGQGQGQFGPGQIGLYPPNQQFQPVQYPVGGAFVPSQGQFPTDDRLPQIPQSQQQQVHQQNPPLGSNPQQQINRPQAMQNANLGTGRWRKITLIIIIIIICKK